MRSIQKGNKQDLGGSTQDDLCSECSSQLIEDDNGDMVCGECGLIHDDVVIDHGPEWRSFSDDLNRDNKRRVGSPMTELMHDRGLSTTIGDTDEDANGNRISKEQQNKYRHLRKWDKKYKIDSSELGLRFALSEINRMGSALGIPNDAQETAGVIYRRCSDKDIIVGYSIEGVSTACLYIAARQFGVPRTLKEFFTVCRLSDGGKYDNSHITSIGRVYRMIKSELNINLEPVTPDKYFDRYINELDLDNPMHIRDDAKKILEVVQSENRHSGVSASCLAATAVYCSAGVNDQYRTQKEVSDMVGVAPETIRLRYQDFCDVLDVDEKKVKFSESVELFE